MSSQAMRVFAFLDLEHPPVAWAVMRGMMVSADLASPLPNSGFISFMLAGMIQYQNNPRIFNESLIEGVRAAGFRHQVSRMHGMYFFKSQAEAEARIGDINWPPYFVAENLLHLELHPNGPISVVDANWITFAPLDQSSRIKRDDLSYLEWIPRYWAGVPYSESPVWELLANGIALVLDPEVRRRCQKVVEREFPDAQIPMLMARIASEVGTLGGLVTPFLSRENDKQMKLSYVWRDADFHEDDSIKRMALHPDAGKLKLLMTENETWRTPDFRRWSRVFSLGEQAGISDMFRFPSVHHK